MTTSTRRANITITSPSVLTLPGGYWPGGSPEIEKGPLSAYRPHHSRWREDWEELEHLGAGGFGRVGMWNLLLISSHDSRGQPVKARNRLDGRIYAVGTAPIEIALL
jgi:translation initiation factor 2-alpha kinase 4